ncbi:probable DNA N(6)-methyladenine demethylase ALKBH1B [Pyrus communis]|uniref:probable DNA N(6)-methyladenine demethylase ALKBH1B n=1 Tax=Pyrus communis TaxID=23211 RepID=UPI0035C02466
MRDEMKRSMEQKSRSVLQAGMVPLKIFLSLSDQINIVKLCRDLGLGLGGFYQPGYRNGAKLNLDMICLGKNGDLEMSQYEDYRPVDGAKPPKIPIKFFQLDRDESEQSLHKRLTVVSFSIGDSAEFLYGGQRDVDRANKVILESGDVLIYGGNLTFKELKILYFCTS